MQGVAENVNDNLVALPLLQGLKLKDKVVLADKAYSTAKIRDYLEKQGALVCIPDKINAKVKHDFDRELYKKRNVVERFFCRLKDYLRVLIVLSVLLFSFFLSVFKIRVFQHTLTEFAPARLPFLLLLFFWVSKRKEDE